MKNNSLKSLMSASELKDIVSSVLDNKVDILKESPLEEIPFFGVVFKSLNFLRKGSELFELIKLLKFLKEMEDIPEDDRKKMAERLFDPKYNLKTGLRLMNLISNLDQEEKAVLIGKLFKSYFYSETISNKTFLRLATIISNMFYDDLLLLRSIVRPDYINEVFFNAGLVNRITDTNTEYNKRLMKKGLGGRELEITFKYEINKLGEELLTYGLNKI
jgi:hypothetical protein